jgi:hypothetical protein
MLCADVLCCYAVMGGSAWEFLLSSACNQSNRIDADRCWIDLSEGRRQKAEGRETAVPMSYKPTVPCAEADRLYNQLQLVEQTRTEGRNRRDAQSRAESLPEDRFATEQQKREVRLLSANTRLNFFETKPTPFSWEEMLSTAHEVKIGGLNSTAVCTNPDNLKSFRAERNSHLFKGDPFSNLLLIIEPSEPLLEPLQQTPSLAVYS